METGRIKAGKTAFVVVFASGETAEISQQGEKCNAG
jgi:hypothetical protein